MQGPSARVPTASGAKDLGGDFLHPKAFDITHRLIVGIKAVGYSQVIEFVLGHLLGRQEEMLAKNPCW